MVRKRRRFVTSDYVVDETVTLLLVRHSQAAAADFLDSVELSEALRLEWISFLTYYGAEAKMAKKTQRTKKASAPCSGQQDRLVSFS